MKLQYCNIQLNASYDKNPGKYTATIAYEGHSGEEVKMILDSEVSSNLLGFIGPAITRFAAKAAQQIEANVRQSVEEANKMQTLTLPAESEKSEVI